MVSGSHSIIAVVSPELDNPSEIALDLLARDALGNTALMQPCVTFDPQIQAAVSLLGQGQPIGLNGALRPLPAEFQKAISGAHWTLCGSMGSKHANIVRSIQKAASRSVLMLSVEQARDREPTLDLARRSHVTIFDGQQAPLLTGQSDTYLAIRTVQVKGVRGAIALGRGSVRACIEGRWIWFTAEGMPADACSRKEGQIFVGALIGARLDGLPWVEAIRAAATAVKEFNGRAPSGPPASTRRVPWVAGATKHWPELATAATAVGIGVALIVGRVTGII